MAVLINTLRATGTRNARSIFRGGESGIVGLVSFAATLGILVTVEVLRNSRSAFATSPGVW